MGRSTTKQDAAVREGRGPNDRKPRAERWQELLEAAAEIFHEKGYDAASLQEIAKRVGILKGSIYYYIETKADLRNSLLKEVHSEGFEAIRRLADTDGDALDKLEAMVRGHIDYICRHMAKTTVYLQELKKLKPKERADLLGEHSYRDVFRDVIDLGQTQGTILPSLDPELTSRAMLASLNSIYQWFRPGSARSTKALADYFVLTLLRGHATPAGIAAHEEKRASQTSGR